jgi:hypothetical protein
MDFYCAYTRFPKTRPEEDSFFAGSRLQGQHRSPWATLTAKQRAKPGFRVRVERGPASVASDCFVCHIIELAYCRLNPWDFSTVPGGPDAVVTGLDRFPIPGIRRRGAQNQRAIAADIAWLREDDVRRPLGQVAERP